MTNRKKTQKDSEEEISIHSVLPTKVRLSCKNVKQKDFYRLIKEREILFCTGPAGCGKSFISIATAIELLQATDTPYKKLIIINPAVEAEEKLGFIPGSVEEKLYPFAASSLDTIDKIMGEKNRKALVAGGIIKIDALAYIRGKSIDNSILVMEEAQNMSPSQMKTLLTRIGTNSKFIISGDLEQSDRYRDATKSGLYDATNRLKSLNKIGFFTFLMEDVVRNPIITDILKFYKGVEIPHEDVKTKSVVNEDFFIPIKTEGGELGDNKGVKFKIPVDVPEKTNKIKDWFKKTFK